MAICMLSPTSVGLDSRAGTDRTTSDQAAVTRTGQGRVSGRPNGAKCSGPMNEVTSAIRSPRRVSTSIDQAWCTPSPGARR